MRKIYLFTLTAFIFSFNELYSQEEVDLSGFSIESGAIIQSKSNFFDGGYLDIGYSKITMFKPGIFYSEGYEFLGKAKFQTSDSGNLFGASVGAKYHFLISLLSIGLNLEYLTSVNGNGSEFNLVPNFQINLFTPELSVVTSYSINLGSNLSTPGPGRLNLGLRFVSARKKENRFKILENNN